LYAYFGKLTTEKKVEKGISLLVGALTDPIIVFPGWLGRHPSRMAEKCRKRAEEAARRKTEHPALFRL